MEKVVNCWSVEGKVILVTGGVVGIGVGLIRSLVSYNAMHVTFLDVSEREGEALERELLNNFGALKAKFIKCDIANEDQLLNAYKQVLDKYRRLDAVINNASVAYNESLQRMVDASFNTIITSTFKALEEMRVDKSGNGGIILNLSSFLVLSQPNNLLQELSKEVEIREPYSKTSVRIITVFLGPTDTALLHRSNYIDHRHHPNKQVPETQRVSSAVTGIMDVITRAESGSTWIIVNDKAPFGITDTKEFSALDLTNRDFEEFENKMEDILTKLSHKNKSVIVCGDFNVDILHVTSSNINLEALLDDPREQYFEKQYYGLVATALKST